MTTITIDRAVAKQMLGMLLKVEAELKTYYTTETEEVRVLYASITALRAALAQEQAKPQGCDHCNHPLYAATRCRVCGRVTEPKAQEPTPPPEARTEAEKTAYAAGWWDALRKAQQAEPVEPVAHRVVAGALFDFMGWLTSRRERLMLSSIDDAAPAADAIKDFAEMRGLSLDDAKVQDWNTAPPQRKPLTEEEIDHITDQQWTANHDTPVYAAHRAYARAIERAHGITDPQVADRLARHGIPMPDEP